MARTFVMGDPQAPFAKVLEVLAHHGALAGDRIAPDVTLVSIGDHFDFDQQDPDGAGVQGTHLLRWLAGHDPAQVPILLGNHDAARVMELIGFSDAAFAEARRRARAIDGPEAAAEFAAAYPDLPAPGTVGRDFASYSTAQRDAVVEYLLAGRLRLALAGELPDGRACLLTHAGVTSRELALLGVASSGSPTSPDPRTIAAALEAYLRAAVDAVRAPWQRGELVPLSLEPVHRAGAAGEEGGGLLYHRPSNPDRPGAPPVAAARPRRFDPRTLPPGLTQVAGHSGHAKCVHELDGWVTPRAHTRARGGIRTLRVEGATVTYDLGVAPPAPGAADLILIDGELRRVPASDVELLPLARIL
ncbi:MAG: transcriptional regulator [Deltaproteobacteria bacterium]|nr:transcriptional regulator [Deltaproteobacteria bacterium]